MASGLAMPRSLLLDQSRGAQVLQQLPHILGRVIEAHRVLLGERPSRLLGSRAAQQAAQHERPGPVEIEVLTVVAVEQHDPVLGLGLEDAETQFQRHGNLLMWTPCCVPVRATRSRTREWDRARGTPPWWVTGGDMPPGARSRRSDRAGRAGSPRTGPECRRGSPGTRPRPRAGRWLSSAWQAV